MQTAMAAKNSGDQSLAGTRVLLIEDEYYIADDVCRALLFAGAKVIGPVSTVSAGREAIEAGGFDCAVLDLNLHGENAIPLADRLHELGVSFVIATGYASPAVPERLESALRIEKPFDPSQLVELLTGVSPARPGAS